METGPEQFTDTQQTWARVYLSLVVTFLMTSMSDRNIIIWGSEGTDGASYLWDWPGIVGVRRAAVDVRLSQQGMTFLSFFLKVATFSFTTIGCKLRTRLLLFFLEDGWVGGMRTTGNVLKDTVSNLTRISIGLLTQKVERRPRANSFLLRNQPLCKLLLALHCNNFFNKWWIFCLIIYD